MVVLHFVLYWSQLYVSDDVCVRVCVDASFWVHRIYLFTLVTTKDIWWPQTQFVFCNFLSADVWSCVWMSTFGFVEFPNHTGHNARHLMIHASVCDFHLYIFSEIITTSSARISCPWLMHTHVIIQVGALYLDVFALIPLPPQGCIVNLPSLLQFSWIDSLWCQRLISIWTINWHVVQLYCMLFSKIVLNGFFMLSKVSPLYTTSWHLAQLY